jgi:predicted RNase H-like HicB family nuclease
MEKISILLEHKIEGFRASILGLPDCQAQGATREDALANVQTVLRSRLASAEIVTVPFESTALTQLTGIFKDDPQWDEFQAAMASYRKQQDEELEAEYLQTE